MWIINFFFSLLILAVKNFESWRTVFVIGKWLIFSSIYLMEVEESNSDDLVQKLVNMIWYKKYGCGWGFVEGNFIFWGIVGWDGKKNKAILFTGWVDIMWRRSNGLSGNEKKHILMGWSRLSNLFQFVFRWQFIFIDIFLGDTTTVNQSH